MNMSTRISRRGMLLASLVCALALLFGLSACGGGGTANPEEPFLGYWELESAEGDELELSADDVETFKSLGGNIIMHLDEDGKGEFDFLGEVGDVTWDAGKKTLTYEDESMDIEIKDDKLILSYSSGSFTFTKGSDDLADVIKADKEAAEESDEGADAAATTEPIDPITVADDDVCSIVITEKAVDDWGDAGYTVEITNKTDKNITVWVPADVTSRGGTMDELYLSESLLPSTNATAFMYFSDVDSIEELADVTTTIEVYDKDTLDDLASYSVEIA